MRFSVDPWAPEYGQAAGDAASSPLEPTAGPVDVSVEVPADDWAPVSSPPGTDPARTVLFVDGVRRIDARVWVPTADGTTRTGICATYAAGAVRCGERAEVAALEVRRGLFCPAPDLEPVHTAFGDYLPHAVDGEEPDRLSLALQGRMGALEGTVAAQAAAAAGAELVVLDGPLRGSGSIPGAVGYVKTHHVGYLPPAVHDVVAALGAGQRTPLFCHGAPFTRWSWYLRLPGPRPHAWAGVVRCEVDGSLGPAEAITAAHLVTATLPRYASQAHKDPRAPQNLHPIAGLERELRRRLGDPARVERALRVAAHASA